jgi:energy-coupling factor transporter ATP-binding protein EcfA2
MNLCDIDPRMPVEQAMSLSDEGKLIYFDRVKLQHPRVHELLEDLTALTSPGSGTDIALLIGPAGVGKSTLIGTLRNRILKAGEQAMVLDPCHVPVIVVDAPASGETKFSWRMLYMRLGTALNEPLLDRKVETYDREGRALLRMGPAGSTVASLRVAIETTLAHRRTNLVVIDEAVHMLRTANGKELANHMDAIKALAGRGTTLTLVGSYDLHEVAELSAQVSRRTEVVHFSRYLTGVDADDRAWRTTLKALQERLPLKGVPDLLPLAPVLQTCCAGCVGILKTTLAKALARAIQAGGKWSDHHLEQSLLSERQLDTILSEIIEGERRIGKTAAGTATFDSLTIKARQIEAQAKQTA